VAWKSSSSRKMVPSGWIDFWYFVRALICNGHFHRKVETSRLSPLSVKSTRSKYCRRMVEGADAII
jgi:hypothetical protein